MKRFVFLDANVNLYLQGRNALLGYRITDKCFLSFLGCRESNIHIIDTRPEIVNLIRATSDQEKADNSNFGDQFSRLAHVIGFCYPKNRYCYIISPHTAKNPNLRRRTLLFATTPGYEVAGYKVAFEHYSNIVYPEGEGLAYVQYICVKRNHPSSASNI